MLATTRAQLSELVQQRTQQGVRLSEAERSAKQTEKLERKLVLAETKIARLEQNLAMEQKLRLRATQQLELKRLVVDATSAEAADLKSKLSKFDEDDDAADATVDASGGTSMATSAAPSAPQSGVASPHGTKLSLGMLRLQSATAKVAHGKKGSIGSIAGVNKAEKNVSNKQQQIVAQMQETIEAKQEQNSMLKEQLIEMQQQQHALERQLVAARNDSTELRDQRLMSLQLLERTEIEKSRLEVAFKDGVHKCAELKNQLAAAHDAQELQSFNLAEELGRLQQVEEASKVNQAEAEHKDNEMQKLHDRNDKLEAKRRESYLWRWRLFARQMKLLNWVSTTLQVR